ncbi:MAG: LPXTG cell wall anchor domain-containing protein, partial [Patescibacteria group bacterium]
SIIRSFVLGVIAWKAQGAYTVIAEKFNKLEDLVIVAVVAIALAGIGWFIWRKKKNQPQIGI